MKHLWSGVAAAAMVSLAATAAAQAPLSPSGAVNSREPPAIGFPGAASPSPARGSDRGPPAGAASGTMSRPAAEVPGTAGAASDETAASRPEAATSAEGEGRIAVSRPKRPVRGAERERPRSTARGEDFPGDNVANMLNARELSRFTGSGGSVPIVRPMGLPLGYPRPPVFGPPGYYGPPPGYGPPLYPPPMMSPPY